MSEGSITYGTDGASCGIFTEINSQLRNHRVCDDGLACIDSFFDLNQETTVKKCSQIRLPPGASCNPLYVNCLAGLECRKNEIEEYTCGGTITWNGNDEAINTKLIVTSLFKPDYTLVIIGVIIILLDIVLYWYIFYYKKKDKGNTNEKKSLVSDQSIY